MSERLRGLSEDDLGLALRDLGPRLDYPRNLDVAAAVIHRIEAEAVPGVSAPVRVRRGLLERILPPRGVRRTIALAFVILGLATTTAVAVGLGIRGIDILITDDPPPSRTAAPATTSSSPTPSPSASPSPSFLGEGLVPGFPTTLEEARAEVDYPLAVPHHPLLTDPQVLSGVVPRSGSISLVYRARDGLPPLLDTEVGALLTQFRGELAEEFIEKIVFQGGDVEEVTVNGERGLFISGEFHEVHFIDEDGMIFTDDIRLAGNVLIWQRGDVSYRLEAQVSKQTALEIARSVS